MSSYNIPKKYVPDSLSEKDKKKQIKSIKEGKKRPKVDYKSRRSTFVVKFEKKYGKKITDKKWIHENLLRYKGQAEILSKGRGAYYSSGSRPNTKPEQWALGRLASVLVGGKARQVDKKIYDKYKR